MKTRLFAALITIATVLVLSACSKPPEPKATGDAPPRTSTATTRVATPLDPLLKNIDKAKGVQKTIDDAAAKQRKVIDDAGG